MLRPIGFLVLFVGLVAGCAPLPGQSRDPLDAMVGSATKADISRHFGPPSEILKEREGEVWIYRREPPVIDETPFRTRGQAIGRDPQRIHVRVFYLDREGVLLGWSEKEEYR